MLIFGRAILVFSDFRFQHMRAKKKTDIRNARDFRKIRAKKYKKNCREEKEKRERKKKKNILRFSQDVAESSLF